MYKITLYDWNCPSCYSGTISVFVDDLNEFERHWIPKMKGNKEVVDRYLRSKAGELVTDYHKTNNDAELNIVQEDKLAKVLRYKNYERHNTYVTLANAYDYTNKWYFRTLRIFIRYIRYNNEYFKVASFSSDGGCTKYGSDYMAVYNSGNPFIKLRNNKRDRHNTINSKNSFMNDKADLFVWKILNKFNSLDELLDNANKNKRLSQEEIIILMSDIPGDAG